MRQEQVATKAHSDEVQRFEVQLMTYEDIASTAAMIRAQLDDEMDNAKFYEQFCKQVPILEEQDQEISKMLQRMKPLCSHFVFFVQHIAAKRDKN